METVIGFVVGYLVGTSHGRAWPGQGPHVGGGDQDVAGAAPPRR